MVQSAGDRLKDIKRITLEVDAAPHALYRGTPSRDELLKCMTEKGFELIVRRILPSVLPMVAEGPVSNAETNLVSADRHVQPRAVYRAGDYQRDRTGFPGRRL